MHVPTRKQHTSHIRGNHYVGDNPQENQKGSKVIFDAE